MRACFKDTKLANDEFQRTFKLEHFFFFFSSSYLIFWKKSLKSNLLKKNGLKQNGIKLAL